MKIRMFGAVIKRGLVNVVRNRGMSLASVGSVSATLVILGIVLLTILNINGVAQSTQGQFDQVQAYLDKDLDEDKINELSSNLKKIDNVKKVTFFSDKEALKDLKEKWGDSSYLLDGYEKENPLPHSFIIKIDDLDESDEVVKDIKETKGIRKVNYYKEVIDKLNKVAGFVKNGGVILIAVLVFISVFIISNTVKITVAARQKEIGIMKYVGATNGFIRGPFIVEGIFLGMLGSFISLFLTFIAYKSIFDRITEAFFHIISTYLISPGDIMVDLVIIFMAIGVGIGMLGSILSLRRYLKV